MTGTVTLDTAAPSFTSLTREATAEYINATENTQANELIDSLTASDYDTAKYAIIPNGNNCNTGSYGSAGVTPKSNDTFSAGDGVYKVCVKLEDSAGNPVAYGATTDTITLDTADPNFNSIPLANEASDGYINNDEKLSASALLGAIDAVDNVTEKYKAVSSTTTCNDALTYGADGVIPPVTDIGSLSDGTYKVCIEIADIAGNIIYAESDPITLDASPATITAAPALAGDASGSYINLGETSNATDLVTDATATDHDTIVYTVTTAATACSDATGWGADGVLPQSDDMAAKGDGSYKVCAKAEDSAGNTAAYAGSANFTLDKTVPAFTSLTRDANAEYINATENSAANELIDTLTATGYDTAKYAIVPNANNCNTGSYGSAGVTPKSNDTFSAGDGVYKVCVKLEDSAGNPLVYGATTDTITLDTVAPGFISLTRDANAEYINATENGAANELVDALTASNYDTAKYAIVPSANDCNTGSYGSAGVTPKSNDTFAGGDGVYKVCVLLEDNALNATYGTMTGSVTLDTAAPTSPSIAINSGNGYTTSTSGTLTLSAADGPNEMYITNTAGCGSGGNWESYNTSKAWTLGQTDATATVYVKFRDLALNETSCVNDTIIHDNTIPGDPTAVSVPTTAQDSFNITFTPGTEANPGDFNIKACTNSNCSDGCVGETTTSSSPGTISHTALTHNTGYFGCVQATDLAGNSSSYVASDSTTLFKYIITIEAAYPTNGANFFDYVARSNTSLDRVSQTDTACVAGNETYLGCIHGGEYRKGVLQGTTSCTGLTISDSLGVFNWSCKEIGGGQPAVIYSSGFRDGKGLTDLIDMSGTLAFKSNKVTVSGAYSAESEPAVWWSNTIRDIIGEGLNVDTPNLLTASGVNDIFVIKSDLTADGYQLNSDKIGLVIASGAAFTYPLTGWAISIGSQNYTWVEGYVISVDGNGLNVNGSKKTRIRNVASQLNNLIGINVNVYGTGDFYDNVKISGGYRAIQTSNSYNMYNNIHMSHTRAGLMMWGGAYNYFNNITLANTQSWEGFNCRFTSFNYYSNVLVNGTQYGGFSGGACDNSVITNLTVAASNVYPGFGVTGEHINIVNALVVTSGDSANSNLGNDLDNGNFNSIVNLASVAPVSSDIIVGPDSVTVDHRFHGALGSSGLCAYDGTPVLPGITIDCVPDDNSTATYIGAIDAANVFVGPIGINDTANETDTNGTMTYNDSLINDDLINFDNRFRTWSKNSTSEISTRGAFFSNGQAGYIFDHRFKTDSDPKIYQRNPAFTNGANCPSAVAGTETATNSLGQTFLLNAVEIMFDDIGNDDGLCEADESCIYTPNIGAYQGEGDYTTLSCVFQPNGGISGITIYAYPRNGVSSSFAQGDGTEGNPYLVESPEDLYRVRNDLTAYYKQIADIDLSGYTNWEPIGDNTTPFTGSYDGDGYTIDNMTIDRATTDYVGLFGEISSATIRNVGITNADVLGRQHVGALVGLNSNGTIVNSSSTGNVEANNTLAESGGVGGLVGENNLGTISYSHSTANVIARHAGGNLNKNAGGLVGINLGDISKSYATGDVYNEWRITGGLVGWNGNSGAPGTITDSYATGNVTGVEYYVGGLTGLNRGSGSTVVHSYSVGTVTAAGIKGGLIGSQDSGAITTNSYWNTQTSTLGTSDDGTGQTTAEMRRQATFSGWNFSSTWEITEDVRYPTLLNSE
jgi:hypothetical protein